MIIKEYFPDKELMCPCGCGSMPTKESVERLYALRLLYKKPIPINSGARCVYHNNKVEGRPGSVHLQPILRIGDSKGWGGCAFDLGITDHSIIKLALFCGFNGFGFGKTFIHIDDANRVAFWGYK